MINVFVFLCALTVSDDDGIRLNATAYASIFPADTMLGLPIVNFTILINDKLLLNNILQAVVIQLETNQQTTPSQNIENFFTLEDGSEAHAISLEANYSSQGQISSSIFYSNRAPSMEYEGRLKVTVLGSDATGEIPLLESSESLLYITVDGRFCLLKI